MKPHSNQDSGSALYDAALKGMLALLARNMKYPPDRDDLGKVAKLLAADLLAEGLTDDRKLTEVLATIGRTFEAWPSTALIMTMMRPEKQLPYHQLVALEQQEKVSNPAVREKALAMARSILKPKTGEEPKREKPEDLPPMPTYTEDELLTPDEIRASRQAFLRGGRSAQREYLEGAYRARGMQYQDGMDA